MFHSTRKLNKLNASSTSYPKGIIASLLILVSTASLGGDFQHNILFSPDKGILVAEANGRVMIYDQLKSETIDKAMDEQFDRIESMMFVRTQYQQEDGGYVVMDDDCD